MKPIPLILGLSVRWPTGTSEPPPRKRATNLITNLTSKKWSRINNSDAGYYSKCFYSYSARLIEKSDKEANTLINIHPVSDEMSTMLDEMRQLSEANPFKDYTDYPLRLLFTNGTN